MIASTAPLNTDAPSGEPDPAGPGLGPERDLLGDRRAERRERGVVADAGRQAELREPLAGEVDDRPALGRLVADRRHERGPEDVRLGHAGRGA